MSDIRIPGKELTIGDKTYVFAPLNVAAVKQYRDAIKGVFVGGLPDIELVAKLAYASLKRNYPDIALADIEDFLDYSNYFDIWDAILNLSGLVAQAGNMARRVQEQMTAQGLKPA